MIKIIIALFFLTSCTNDLQVVKIMPYNKPSGPVATSVRMQVTTSKVKNLNKFRNLALKSNLKILIYPDAGKSNSYNVSLLGLSQDLEACLKAIKDEFPVQEIEK